MNLRACFPQVTITRSKLILRSSLPELRIQDRLLESIIFDCTSELGETQIF